MEPTRTAKEIREELARKGLTIADLAREYDLRLPVVYDLLNERRHGTRGESYRAAVILGLREEKSAAAAAIVEGRV